MKKTILIALAITFFFAGYAQKKPKINKANALREKGELIEAKSIIDDATTYEKTKDDGKTWYYRGLIYATIDTTTNDAFNELKPNALKTAVESFNKADELAEDGKEYFSINASGFPVTKTDQMYNYYNYYYNIGVNNYQEEKFKEAVEGFEKANYINPSDSNAVINAAFAAHTGEMYDKAVELYQKAIDLGADSKDYFYNMIGIVGLKNDPELSLKYVNQALEKYPNDLILSRNKIDLLIKMDKVEEALSELQKAIVDEPDNAGLYYALGVIYDQLENYEMAIASYDNAIKIDPAHYESQYNKGVILLDAANKIIVEQNNLGMSKADAKKSRDLQASIKEKLTIAMPQWEKIVELSPEADKVQNMEYLVFIYSKLRMDKKAIEVQDKIDAMQ